MNRVNAEAAINSVFRRYGIGGSAIPAGASSHARGKVYELYVLTLVIQYLRGLGYRIRFSAPRGTIQFKTSPGLLNASDPHFIVSLGGKGPLFDIYLDVEFETLGSSRRETRSAGDLSHHHELDIGVFKHGLDNIRPKHTDVALAVECKAVVMLEKAVVRGMLGLRRELSFLSKPGHTCLSKAANVRDVTVPADPPSEVWLVSTDPVVERYADSPGAFGIMCKFEDP